MLTASPPTISARAREHGRQRPLLRDLDAVLVCGSLAGLVVLAWIALIGQSGRSFDLGAIMLAAVQAPSIDDTARYLAGWTLVVAAVLLPGAIPMIVRHRLLGRRFAPPDEAARSTMLFTGVYFASWFAFGILVLAAAMVAQSVVTANPDLAGAKGYVIGCCLIAGGSWQLCAAKCECLDALRRPPEFLMENWRSGIMGTIRMGLIHAGLSFGCYWGLIVILVAVGTVALPWMLVVAAVICAETLLPNGRLSARAIGGVLCALGLYAAARPELAAMLGRPIHL